jgi:ABC-type sugar transport system permease subunit/ABC-type glycerol-3-phosphate transport system substrate-binding protein
MVSPWRSGLATRPLMEKCVIILAETVHLGPSKGISLSEVITQSWLRATAALAVVLAFLPQAWAEKQMIVIWGMSSSANDKGTDAVVREFEARNPQYKVRLLGMGAGGMNPQKLMTAIVGKAPPDVIQQDRFNVHDWASRGAFRPLDDLLKRDSGHPDTPKREDYYASGWDEGVYEGQTYCIPRDTNIRMLYWNKRVFRKEAARLRAAGLDPERPPRTWGEVSAYSRVLTTFNPDGTLKRVGFVPDFGANGLYGYVLQADGSYLSPDGKTATFENPQVRQSIDFMMGEYKFLGGIKNTDAFGRSWAAENSNPFIDEKVVMMITGEWELTWWHALRPNLEMGAAPPPVPDDRFLRRGHYKNIDKTFATWVGGYGLAIPTGAKNVEGAWAFIKFATSFEGRKIDLDAQKELYQSRGQRFFPNVMGQKQAAEYQAELFGGGNSDYDRSYRSHIEAMEFSVARRSTFAAQAVWDAQIRMFDQVIQGRLTPERAATEANISTQKILNEFYSMQEMPLADTKTPALILGGAFLAFMAGFFVWVARQARTPLSRQDAWAGYAFILPWLAGFVIFTLGPMLASFYLSFTVYNVLSPPRWVGFQNYVDVFQRDLPLLVKGFQNVFYMAGMGIPIGNAIGLITAILLNTEVKGMKLYRTVFYLPAILPSVGAVVLWAWILDANPDTGLANSLWEGTITQWFAVNPPAWFTSEHWAKPSLLIMGAWGAASGYLLWLAGLKGIPATLYEAAEIDGASPWQRLSHVTIPQLSPLIFFSLVMSVIGAIQSFDTVYLITGGSAGGPGDSLMMPVLLLFQNGFNYFRMGYASALAWILFVIILGLTLINLGLGRRWVHSEVKD